MTFDELIKEHEQLWGDTTLKQQKAKWFEERDELVSAKTKKEELYELADMVIVSAGISRFDYLEGIKTLYASLTNMDLRGRTIRELWKAVEKKMKKNRARTWQKVDGVGYHHVEG